MLLFIRDLFRHEAWADAEHVRAFLAHPAAVRDPEIHSRLYHIHQCQAWYLGFFRGTPPEFAGGGQPLPPLAEIGRAMREYQRGVQDFLTATADEGLSTPMKFPFRDSPQVTLGEAMVQVVLHSQYHRAQNASRLRALGGEPPITDFVMWVLKDRPEPDWGS